jgi:hypothetical protein
MHKANVELIKTVFVQLNIDWVEPYMTTEGAINRKETGAHRGLYYIYPEKNFYFGKAATNTVINRHITHRPKLDVNLSALYGPVKSKKEPKWSNPRGFREGVSLYLLEGNPTIPDHFIATEDGVSPGVLDFPVKHVVDIDTLSVLVWNLDHLTAAQISEIEHMVIQTIWPYCNSETYRKRNS